MLGQSIVADSGVQGRSTRYRGTAALVALAGYIGVVTIVPALAQIQATGAKHSMASSGEPSETQALSESERSQFESAFTALSSAGHVTVIAEGVPLCGKLSVEQLRVLDGKLPPDRPAKLADAITDVADSFDYDAERVDAHTYLLRKRYSDPQDLPYVSYAEVRHALRAILQLTDAFTETGPIVPADPKMDSAIKVFVASLSEEQLKSATSPQPLSSLSPDQQKLAISASRYLWVCDEARYIRRTLAYIDALKEPNNVLTWMIAPNVRSFAYRGPFGPFRRVASQPISDGVYISQLGVAYNWVKAIRPLPDVDPTLPNANDVRLASGMLADKLACTATLREKAASTKAMVTVDDAVADKPVSVFGAAYCDSDHLIRSLSALYGLKLTVPEHGVYKITLPMPLPSDGLEDLSGEFSRLIPLPLTRSLKGRGPWLAKEVARQGLPEIYGLEVAKTYYFAPMRRVVVLGKPLVPSPDSLPVPMSSANPEIYRLITLAILSDGCMRSLEQLSQLKLPICFIHPEMMRFEAALRDNHAYFSFDSGDAPPREPGSNYNYGHMMRGEILTYPAR